MSGTRLPTADQVRAELAADSLREFTPIAWPIVEPGTPHKTSWHIDTVLEHLEAVTTGELRRLIINIPPRHMKSTAVAVLWPCWSWLRRPQLRWLFASYAEKLSKRDSLKCRRIIESHGGRQHGGTLLERVGYQGLLGLLGQTWTLTSDQNEKLRFENSATGYRIATSVGGTATGEGGDVIVIDDPHKVDQVESDLQRDNVLDWMDGTMSTRLNDPATGRVVIVMQRLHETDLTGHLLEQGGYTHLCLPAEYEPAHPFVWPDDPRIQPGELLWPNQFDQPALDEIRGRLGAYRAAGQLQQRPAPQEGGIIKTAWWRYYDPSLLDFSAGQWRGPRFQRLHESWDTALKDKTTSDYTVGQLWGQDLSRWYLLRQVRGRFSFTEALEQMRQMRAWTAKRFPDLHAHRYVENSAMGPELMAAAQRSVGGSIPITADKDKVSRAYAVTPLLELGEVFLPGAANLEATGCDPALTPAWVQELIAECAAFPNAANDDQVDALTQALDPRRLRDGPKRPKREQRARPVTARLAGAR